MNKGVTIDGKLVRFKRRERTKGTVVGKKASKGKAQSKPTKAKVVKPSTQRQRRKRRMSSRTGKAIEPSEAAEPQPATTS